LILSAVLIISGALGPRVLLVVGIVLGVVGIAWLVVSLRHEAHRPQASAAIRQTGGTAHHEGLTVIGYETPIAHEGGEMRTKDSRLLRESPSGETEEGGPLHPTEEEGEEGNPT
jgi:hypothetical protein